MIALTRSHIKQKWTRIIEQLLDSVQKNLINIALGLLLRHSARSRGIQQPQAQSVLQAFLDAATARSMTGVCAQHDRRVRYGISSHNLSPFGDSFRRVGPLLY